MKSDEKKTILQRPKKRMNHHRSCSVARPGGPGPLWKVLAAIPLTCALMAQAQTATVTLNEASTVLANPLRIGVNNASATNYDQGQFCKNWLCSNNPSFQGTIVMQTVPITAGSTTSFTGQNTYDLAPAGIWAGASYSGMVSPSGSAFPGSSGTISTNTTASGKPIVYTFKNAGVAAAKGDYARIWQQIDSTPGGLCSSGSNQLTCAQGWWNSVSGGAAISAQSTDLPPSSYDAQTLTVDTTPTGAAASVTTYIDGTYGGKAGNFLPLWSGTSYTMSLKCKTAAGAGNVTLSVQRLSTGGQKSTGTGSCTNSWSTISLVFTGTETSSTGVGTIAVSASFPQGLQFKITDVYVGQTTYSNPTAYNDSYVKALKAFAGDTLRLWDFAVGDTLDDMIKPIWGRHATMYEQGNNYFSYAKTAGSGY